MRQKLIWFIYGVYLLSVGIAAFGSHPLTTNEDLANLALKSPIIKPIDWNTAPIFDFTGNRINHSYEIIAYSPNIGGFMVYASSGAILAYIMQGNKQKD